MKKFVVILVLFFIGIGNVNANLIITGDVTALSNDTHLIDTSTVNFISDDGSIFDTMDMGVLSLNNNETVLHMQNPYSILVQTSNGIEHIFELTKFHMHSYITEAYILSLITNEIL